MTSKIYSGILLSMFITSIGLSQLSTRVNSTSKASYPTTKKVGQQDTYFGKVINDPYRWLENDTSPEVSAWVKGQNEATSDYLSQIPYRSKIHDRMTELINYERFPSAYKIGDYYIYEKNDGLQNQSVFYFQKGIDGTPQVFIDSNTMSKDGNLSISILGFSNDKKFVAYAINESGSDWQQIRVKQIEGAKDLKDSLKGVKFSDASWYKNGFYYSRYDISKKGKELSDKNENHQVWYHKINTSQSDDKLVFEDKQHPMRLNKAQVTEDEHYLFIYSREGAGNAQIMYKDLTKPDAPFKMLFKGFEYSYKIIDNAGSSLFVMTNDGAPNRKIITLDLDMFQPEKPISQQTRVIIPEGKSILLSATTTGSRLILNYLQDVNSHIFEYTYEGKLETEVKLPANGNATVMEGFNEDRELFISFTSFTFPPSIYRFHLDNHHLIEFKKSVVKFKPDDYVTEQVFYPGKDGTKIPMFIVYKKGLVKNGKNPTLLYAYGGFNVNMYPVFSASRLFLLDNGGIYAQANIRGGGEYGNQWHNDGMLLKKQNVFDDFIAAGQYLVNEKYTSPFYLAAMGTSNGGLLVGAVINQRPDLFKVAFPQVGLMDMLRYHKFTIGWSWVPEYGTSDSSADFNNLIKYSPLHNIQNRVYPATLVTTADHDDRVVPAHSYKYIATLQEHQYGPAPVLIRVDVKAGHGAGKPISKVIDELTDTYSFMFYNMNITPK